MLTQIEAFDLDTSAGRVFKDVQFFDPDPGHSYTLVFKAHGGDLLGKRLDKVHVAYTDEAPDAVGDVFVANHFGEFVILGPRSFPDREIQVDPDTLGLFPLMFVDPDEASEYQVPDKDVPDSVGCIRNAEGLNHI